MRIARSGTRVGLLLAAVSVVGYAAATGPGPALGAELQARTAAAYDQYLARTTRDFLARASGAEGADPPRNSGPSVGPGGQDGIIDVPGGLVHHWAGTSLVRGVRLPQVVEQSRAYPRYGTVHKAVVASRVLEQAGDTFRVLMRIKEGAGGITGVIEIRSTVRYSYPTNGSVLVLSNADEIREVQNAGARDERLLPVGRDSGYLWRANTFTRYVETADGVWIQMETLGLSRRFPPLLGWLIEPIARRLGRRSVETTLQEFGKAVSQGLAP